MSITQRMDNTNVLRVFVQMIRNAPMETVLELKQNFEKEKEFHSHRNKEAILKEFSNRLGSE